MPTIEDYLAAICDLAFVDHPWYEGQCPSCGQPGFTLKLIDLRQCAGVISDRLVYEPWCDHCTLGEIQSAVLAAVETAKAA